jgi:hypothetical protein
MNVANCGDSAEPVPNRKASTARQLEDLTSADRPALQDAWLTVFGRRPPVRLSSELLVLALSYEAQIGRSGGLVADDLQALGIADQEWIAGGTGGTTITRPESDIGSSGPNNRGRAPGDIASSAPPDRRSPPRPVRRSIKPGTRLLREWQGQTHEVIAESTGRFLYRGDTYRSLSAIARAITGTRWSGPTFFGITTKSQAQKAGGDGDDR